MAIPTRANPNPIPPLIIDDNLKDFFTNLMQSSKNNLQMTIDKLSRDVQANSSQIDNILVTQQYLTTEVHQNGGGFGQRGSVLQFGGLTRVNFPKFNGEDVKGWLYRCNHFFKIDDVADNNKVKMAAMHLYDRALVWHHNFERIYGEDVEWDVFASAIYDRFSTNHMDPMEELKNLRQEGTVEAYQDSYEELLNKVELTEQQAISFYIGGLKSEIGLVVKMFGPKPLKDVYKLARMQEATKVAMAKRYAPLFPTPKTNTIFSKPYANYVKVPNVSVTTLTSQNGNKLPANHNFKKQKTQKDFDDRRAKNMCFFCDQPNSSTHREKCIGRMYSLEVIPSEEEEVDEGTGQVEQLMSEMQDDCPYISLNALSGVTNYQTIRVQGMVGSHLFMC